MDIITTTEMKRLELEYRDKAFEAEQLRQCSTNLKKIKESKIQFNKRSNNHVERIEV